MKLNWGTGIVVTFIVFFVGLGVIVTIAMNQRNDLVTDDYYAQELKHEDQMNRERRSASLQQPVKFVIESKGLAVRFPEELEPSRISGDMKFYRPADERKDFVVPVLIDSSRTQIVPIASLAKGLWRVKMKWSYGTDEYYNEETVVVP